MYSLDLGGKGPGYPLSDASPLSSLRPEMSQRAESSHL